MDIKGSRLSNSGISTAQIEQCFRQLPISLVVNLVNALFLAVVLWQAVSTSILLIWLFLLGAVTAARYLTMLAFNKALADARLEHRIWRRYFVAGACAAGLVWGISGVLLFHPDSFPHQVFLAFVLGGMVAGAVPLLSSIGTAFQCFAIPIVVPISVRLLLVGDTVHLMMGLMGMVFGVAMLASSAQVRRLFRDSEDLRRELLTSIETGRALELMVRLDPLTGIANRRLFEEELNREWARAKREDTALAVITADIDHFKEFNDFYGHSAGDKCLTEVAQTMQHALSRPGDIVARIGGEEFAFVLPRTTLHGAVSVAELVRDRILALGLPHKASPDTSQVTMSFGVACSDVASFASADELLHASDMALYEAKRLGRDRIAVHNHASGAPDTGPGNAT